MSELPTDETTDEPTFDADLEVDDAEATTQSAPHAATTGHPDVDAVLASLSGLEDRPSTEHVEVFEAAHDRLRAALADAGSTAPDA